LAHQRKHQDYQHPFAAEGAQKIHRMKVDNRSERIGVIHDDAVTKVNSKNRSGFTDFHAAATFAGSAATDFADLAH
jgi:hypothetical protein